MLLHNKLKSDETHKDHSLLFIMGQLLEFSQEHHLQTPSCSSTIAFFFILLHEMMVSVNISLTRGKLGSFIEKDVAPIVFPSHHTLFYSWHSPLASINKTYAGIPPPPLPLKRMLCSRDTATRNS